MKHTRCSTIDRPLTVQEKQRNPFDRVFPTKEEIKEIQERVDELRRQTQKISTQLIKDEDK